MNSEDRTGTDTNPVKDEPDKLEARLAELERAGLEKDREIKMSRAKIAGLEKALTEKDGEISALKQSAVKSEDAQRQMREKQSQAVSACRSLITLANPDVPAELITGDSVEAINSALARAKELVSRVKQGLEAENMKIRIPAGAPVRTPPDTGALTAREKIQYAIGGNR